MRRPGSDIRSRWPTHGLRWWIRHTHVPELRLPAASGDRAPQEQRDRPTRLRARTGVAHAAAALSRRLVPPLASAPVRSVLLPLSPASARRSGATDAPDSQTSSLLQTAPGSALASPSSSACLSVRFPSPLFPSPALLPPREPSPSESMDALFAPESKSLAFARMRSGDPDLTRGSAPLAARHVARLAAFQMTSRGFRTRLARRQATSFLPLLFLPSEPLALTPRTNFSDRHLREGPVL